MTKIRQIYSDKGRLVAVIVVKAIPVIGIEPEVILDVDLSEGYYMS